MNEKLSTKELAGLFKVQPGTIRRGYCLRGEYMGLRPIKLPNDRLIWDAAKAERVLAGEKVG